MGGRGSSSASYKAGGTYGVNVRRIQPLSEIESGAHRTFSDMSRDNLRINLNRINESLSQEGRRLASAQRSKRGFERELAYAREKGDSYRVDRLTKELVANEEFLQAKMINVQSLKLTRDIARSYYAGRR